MDVLNHSMHHLCLNATCLINQYMDFQSLIKEFSTAKSNKSKCFNIKDGNNRPTNLISDQAIMELLKLQASISEIKIEVAATQMLLTKLVQSSKNHKILTADEENLSSVIAALQKVGSTLSVDDLSRYRDKFLHCLSLNIILKMNETNILLLKDYLIVNVGNKIIIKELIRGLQHIIENPRFISVKIAAGIFTQLIKYGYGNSPLISKALKKMSGYILFAVMKGHLQHLISLPSSKEILTYETCISSLIKDNLQNDTDAMIRCFTQMISLWVTNLPNLKVSDAISNQHLWTSSKQNDQLTVFYKEISAPIGVHKTVSFINDILERREVNWKNLLTFVSSLLISFPDSRKYLDELISEKLCCSFETMSVELLATSFLLARQLSMEGFYVFTTYTSWFQSHVVKPPHAPSSCTENLEEYCALARGRIFELGGTVAKESEQTAEVEKNVRMVLEEYEITKMIPKSLMEASIFHKVYFQKKFLPALMKPKPFSDLSDTSMKLIEDLLKAQKISKSMYRAYKEECEKKHTKSLQEIVVLDDDSNFDGDEENHYKHFSCILEIIEREIVSEAFMDTNCSTSLTQLLTKLNKILYSVEGSETNEIEPIGIVSLCLKYKHHKVISQMVNDLLDWAGKIHHASDMTYSKLKLLTAVFKVTHEHKLLTDEFCHFIWKFCTEGMGCIPKSTVKGIALYLIINGSSIQVKIPILSHCRGKILKSCLFGKTIENWQVVSTSNLSDAVEHSLLIQLDSKTTLAILTFLCYYINISLCAKKFSNCQIFHHLLYLGKRMEHCGLLDSTLRVTEVFDYPQEKYAKSELFDMETSMDLYRDSCNRIKDCEKGYVEEFTADKFLIREIFVDTKKDLLTVNEKQQLYSYIFIENNLTTNSVSAVIGVILDQLVFDRSWKAISNQEVLEYVVKCLPLLLEACEPPILNAKLFYDIIRMRMKQVSEGAYEIGWDIQWKNEAYAICMFILNLPPSLLFKTYSTTCTGSEYIWNIGNNLHIKGNMENQVFSGHVINDYFLQLNEDPSMRFTLSQNVLSHLLSGIIETINSYEEFLKFCVMICPCIFISIVVHWNKDHKLRLMLKLRIPQLHSDIDLISKTLLEGKSIICTLNVLQCMFNTSAKMFHLKSSNTSEMMITGINLCLACFISDMKIDLKHPDLKNFLKEMNERTAGYITTCNIIKLGQSLLMKKENELNFKTILQQCFDRMTAEYVCNVVLNGKIIAITPVLKQACHGLKNFSVLALKCLTQIELPLHILTSDLFLPSLASLYTETYDYFEKNKAVDFADIFNDIEILEHLAAKNAPSSTIIDLLKTCSSKMSSFTCSLRSEAVRRMLRI
ncbi:uncharacterized protein LOC120345125 isoform X3 [Styela clava]